jgi:hypothetical protein
MAWKTEVHEAPVPIADAVELTRIRALENYSIIDFIWIYRAIVSSTGADAAIREPAKGV